MKYWLEFVFSLTFKKTLFLPYCTNTEHGKLFFVKSNQKNSNNAKIWNSLLCNRKYITKLYAYHFENAHPMKHLTQVSHILKYLFILYYAEMQNRLMYWCNYVQKCHFWAFLHLGFYLSITAGRNMQMG